MPPTNPSTPTPVEIRPAPPGRFGVFDGAKRLYLAASQEEAEKWIAENIKAVHPDPLAVVASHPNVVNVTMEQFFEGEEADVDDALLAKLPKEVMINGKMERVVYFRWAARYAEGTEPLFRKSIPVTKAVFGNVISESAFSRGGGEYKTGFKEEPGCLYAVSLPGEDPLQYFMVPLRFVMAADKRGRDRYETGITDQARGIRQVSEDRNSVNQRTGVNIDPLKTATRELKIQ